MTASSNLREAIGEGRRVLAVFACTAPPAPLGGQLTTATGPWLRFQESDDWRPAR